MFLCDPCYKKVQQDPALQVSYSPWETSHGRCEDCGRTKPCHDVHVRKKPSTQPGGKDNATAHP